MKEIKVLDHGFVRIRNIAGPTRRPDAEFDADDIDPANAARMSFDQMDSDRTREDDLRLARYLMKNRHTTPFEMIVVWVEMKMPIFVARQLVRHRTVSINEVSGRYTKLPAEWYLPTPEAVGLVSASKKQGRDAGYNPFAAPFIDALDTGCRASYEMYEKSLKAGIPTELARCFLHLNHYTHWIWKQDLHNMMHLLSLRQDGHAQYEIRQYADAIYTALYKVLPESMKMYDEFRRLPK